MILLVRWHRFLLLLVLTGCAGGETCSLIGCASQLTVRLPAGTSAATACVAEVCTSEVVGGALLVPLGRRAEGDTAQLTVTVGTQEYEAQVPLTRSRPNGEGCPPVCVTGAAVLEQGRLVPA